MLGASLWGSDLTPQRGRREVTGATQRASLMFFMALLLQHRDSTAGGEVAWAPDRETPSAEAAVRNPGGLAPSVRPIAPPQFPEEFSCQAKGICRGFSTHSLRGRLRHPSSRITEGAFSVSSLVSPPGSTPSHPKARISFLCSAAALRPATTGLLQLFITKRSPGHREPLHLKASGGSFTSANLFRHISDWGPFPPKALSIGTEEPLDHECRSV